MSYRNKLKDMRWQKKRLEIFSKANWRCEGCKRTDLTLHVHHLVYRHVEPWEYKSDELEALCEHCHLKAHNFLRGNNKFEVGQSYTRDEIQEKLGGSKSGFLPTVKGHVICGCFRHKFNPDAPDIILPGDLKSIRETAEIFCRQRFPVPIFVAYGDFWQYVGDYRVESWTENKKEIQLHERRAKAKVNRAIPISRILFLEKVSALEI
jgi:HNH endonuclease